MFSLFHLTGGWQHQLGLTATFMPKPLYGEAGSGMHFHQRLLKGGKNLFYDANGYGSSSAAERAYIAGLLQHGGAVMAFTNPSTNSYRRLVPGYEAPISAIFSLGNRSAAIRIPKYANRPDNARFEFRPPDATCNPYLAMAAQLMAGIAGFKGEMDPTALGFGPVDEDIFTWPAEKRATIKALPTSLDEAMDALISEQGWDTQVNVHLILTKWCALVGPINAEHSKPESYADGLLTVRTDSTAWATNLRLLAPQIVAKLNEALGDGSVTRVNVLGPDAPSWKKGRRSVAGRGPRDTYG